MSIGGWLFTGFILFIAAVGLIGGALECLKSIFPDIPNTDWKPGKHKNLK